MMMSAAAWSGTMARTGVSSLVLMVLLLSGDCGVSSFSTSTRLRQRSLVHHLPAPRPVPTTATTPRSSMSNVVVCETAPEIDAKSTSSEQRQPPLVDEEFDDDFGSMFASKKTSHRSSSSARKRSSKSFSNSTLDVPMISMDAKMDHTSSYIGPSDDGHLENSASKFPVNGASGNVVFANKDRKSSPPLPMDSFRNDTTPFFAVRVPVPLPPPVLVLDESKETIADDVLAPVAAATLESSSSTKASPLTEAKSYSPFSFNWGFPNGAKKETPSFTKSHPSSTKLAANKEPSSEKSKSPFQWGFMNGAKDDVPSKQTSPKEDSNVTPSKQSPLKVDSKATQSKQSPQKVNAKAKTAPALLVNDEKPKSTAEAKNSPFSFQWGFSNGSKKEAPSKSSPPKEESKSTPLAVNGESTPTTEKGSSSFKWGSLTDDAASEQPLKNEEPMAVNGASGSMPINGETLMTDNAAPKQSVVNEGRIVVNGASGRLPINGEALNFDGESRLAVNGESLIAVNGETSLAVNCEASLAVNGEASLAVNGEASLAVNGEWPPAVNGEISAGIKGAVPLGIIGEPPLENDEWNKEYDDEPFVVQEEELVDEYEQRPLAIQGEWTAHAAYAANGESVIYYYNTRTKESTWEKPTRTFPDVFASDAFSTHFLLAQIGEWSLYATSPDYTVSVKGDIRDPPVFYYNRETGASQWERPDNRFTDTMVPSVDPYNDSDGDYMTMSDMEAQLRSNAPTTRQPRSALKTWVDWTEEKKRQEAEERAKQAQYGWLNFFVSVDTVPTPNRARRNN